MSDEVLSGKKIILGVTGGIAAYKACYLVRELVQKGAEVRVVMTPSALEFITPLTFSSLTKNKVIVNTFPVSVAHRLWFMGRPNDYCSRNCQYCSKDSSRFC